MIALVAPAPISHRTPEENLGLGYLAAVLRESGREVTVVDAWLEDLSPQDVAIRLAQISDLSWIGYSCYRSSMSEAIECLQRARAVGVTEPAVAGGYGPTFHPGEFLEAGFDIVVRGEAEHMIVRLSETLESGRSMLASIPGITYKDGESVVQGPMEPFADNLDALPLPARDTSQRYAARRSPAHLASSRGCGAHCLFCSIIAFQRKAPGPQWRGRSVENVVDEIEQLVTLGCDHIKIVDDSFIEPPRDAAWCTRFADELEDRGLNVSLRGSVRADRVDELTVAELSRAGFVSFSCGIENFAPSALKRMNKSATVADNDRALEAFRANGIIVQAGAILFDQMVTMDELWINLEGMRRHIDTVSKGAFTEMYAAEGTPLTLRLRRQGALDPSNEGLGNSSYAIVHSGPRIVYTLMKAWHQAHMHIYDKCIDPISAPKSLSLAQMRRFHSLAIELRGLDLDFMESALMLAKSGPDNGTMDELLNTHQEATKSSYAAIDAQVNRLYDEFDLVYDAAPNPFI